MYYEYAIDPSSLKSREAVKTVLSHFGDKPSRLISGLDKHWFRAMKQAIDKYYDNRFAGNHQEQRVKLENLQKNKFLVKRHHLNKESSSFVTFASKLIEDEIVTALFSEPANHERNTFQLEEIGETNIPKWDALTQMPFERTEKGYMQTLAPLLALSREIKIIDPYFWPIGGNEKGGMAWGRNKKFVKALLDHIIDSQLDEQIKKITFCTSDREDQDGRRMRGIQANMEEYASELVEGRYQGFELVCQVRPHQDVKTGKIMHNRYVLTEIGGIQFGNSFQIHDQDSDHAAVLSRKSHLEERSFLDKTKARETGKIGRDQP